MPRPKSELTDSAVVITVRVTKAYMLEFKRLGGSVWLRQVLADSIRKNLPEKK
jgi:hypothetical protein